MAESDCYGPALPPGLSDNTKPKQDTEQTHTGHQPIGPVLLPEFSNQSPPKTCMDHCVYGPALPPGLVLQQNDEKRDALGPKEKISIGPTMPPDSGSGGASVIGPVAPPGFVMQQSQESDDEESGIIGPVPHAGPSYSSAEHEIDQRARKMKEKIENKSNPEKIVQRESWMTEIPTDLGKNLGISSIAPRKLGTGRVTVDTTAWTETPAEREKREQDEREGKRSKRKHEELRHVSKRDQELAKQVEKHNETKRSESLLEMHVKKLKKEKKKKKKKEKEKEKEKKERRPFNREEDMKINNMDTAKRKALIKRSQELNSKFSHGSKQFI